MSIDDIPFEMPRATIDMLFDAHEDGTTLDITTKNGHLYEDCAIIRLSETDVTIIFDCVIKGNDREIDIEWSNIQQVKEFGS